ncbi:hypothetical protein M501DRAFT_1010532 [Patellaria atrata CBS 101060]|uniref:Nudix hydrolase domain-containing protein n=1 Tax=Patellaria atrata CBS 101060 TaxID=1346257 RepID=A0A9P4SD60_9PEZI|nr:hypothetical protein M501DRAFT_1010532 [Patellaria atrata CBS 101060]
MPAKVEEPFPSELTQHLQTVLLDLAAHPYPYIPSPPDLNKRASVALILRIQPHYTHWPSESVIEVLRSISDIPHVEQKLEKFFQQDWVKYGDPEVLFIKRAARKGDRWPTHVALPGGGKDPEDADDQVTAVREALEEVGVELKQENSITVGNLPQRLVTTSWGKVPLMVLCPYVFLITDPSLPPLRLQPTEVGSAHWVPLRALLSASLRTVEYQDVSARVAKLEMGIGRWFMRIMLGKMIFAAIRLVPAQSIYCSTIPDFMVDDGKSYIDNARSIPTQLNRWWSGAKKIQTPTDKPLLLWGLTLGVMADFLELMPPHNALELWMYPTFKPWDLRFILWAMSYRLRNQKWNELKDGDHHTPAAVEQGLDSVSLPLESEKLGEVGMAGTSVGAYYCRIRQIQRNSRSSGLGILLEGYYDIVRKAVAVTLVTRVSSIGILAVLAYKRFKEYR